MHQFYILRQISPQITRNFEKPMYKCHWNTPAIALDSNLSNLKVKTLP